MNNSLVYEKTVGGMSYHIKCDYNQNFLNALSTPVDCFLFSPPYNIGSTSPAKITNRKFGGYDAKSFKGITDYSDNLPEDEYQANQVKILNDCADHLSSTGVIVYNHQNRYKNRKVLFPLAWIFKTELEVCHYFTWNRRSTHKNGRTQPRQIDEVIYVLCNKNTKPFYAPEHSKKIKNSTTILEFPRQTETDHNAAFPLELAKLLVSLYTPAGGTVSDIYSGSGTTMLAALKNKVNFIGCELLEKYFNQSIARFEQNLM